MTDFRQMHSLHAYSGGTVRDSHPVLYSPAELLPHPQALKRNIYLRTYDTQSYCKSQSKCEKYLQIYPPTRLVRSGGIYYNCRKGAPDGGNQTGARRPKSSNKGRRNYHNTACREKKEVFI